MRSKLMTSIVRKLTRWAWEKELKVSDRVVIDALRLTDQIHEINQLKKCVDEATAEARHQIERKKEIEQDMLLHSMLRLELTTTLGMDFLPSRDRSGNAKFLDKIVELKETIFCLSYDSGKANP